MSVHSLRSYYITSLTQIRARKSDRERVAVRASWVGYDSRAYGTEARGGCSQVWLASQPAQRDADEGSSGGAPSKDGRRATYEERPSGFRMLSPIPGSSGLRSTARRRKCTSMRAFQVWNAWGPFCDGGALQVDSTPRRGPLLRVRVSGVILSGRHLGNRAAGCLDGRRCSGWLLFYLYISLPMSFLREVPFGCHS